MSVLNVGNPPAYLENQRQVVERIKEKYGSDRKLDFDRLNEPVLWAKNPEDVKILVKSFMVDPVSQVDFLSDITAYDNVDQEDGEPRFVLVVQLFSTVRHVRIRIKCLLAEGESALSLTEVFLGANWLEREVFDLFGIPFKGHPNLRRIMMDERFVGHPLRKEYPIKGRQGFSSNIKFNLGANPLNVDTHLKEGEV